MEKNTTWCCSKNFKIILTTIASICLISFIFAIGVWVYKSPLVDVYTVEYVKGFDDILVQTYYKGEKINFPETPQKDGYDFVGWTLDKNSENFLTQEIIVDKELILYAKWKEREFTLKYNDIELVLNHNSIIDFDGNVLTITCDDVCKLIESPCVFGKDFCGWEIYDGKNYFNIEEFSLDNIENSYLELIPVFIDNKVHFDFASNNTAGYEILSLSHEDNIIIGETLSFEILLDASTSNSIPTVTSTNGSVMIEEKNIGCYLISITNFDDNFDIYIDDINTNIYNITYNSCGNSLSYKVAHGDKLKFPNLDNPGYKLIGFKDGLGRYYTSEFIVSHDIELYAVWEECSYNIRFSKSNGMYAFSLNGEVFTSNKVLEVNYNASVEFNIILSSAYSNSNLEVYAISGDEIIYPVQTANGYLFEKISKDMDIVIGNVILNTYSISVDGVLYGEFSYGSWLHVDDDIIIIRDVVTGKEIVVNSLISDSNFGGWRCGSDVLVNCVVQDVAVDNSTIEIFGNYSKNVARISFVVNGGELSNNFMVFVEGENKDLPIPTKEGYVFAGWFVKLVEVNTVVDLQLSEPFENITDFNMTLYAGWIRK